MMIKKFYKQRGTGMVSNALERISRNYNVLFYGCRFTPTAADTAHYEVWRLDYDHEPTKKEVKSAIEELINQQTQEKIVGGFHWNGKPVWLSQENQINFRSPVTLPMRFKLGEEGDGSPVYHTFDSRDELDDFNHAVSNHIAQCIEEGYREKDAVDYDAILQQKD